MEDMDQAPLEKPPRELVRDAIAKTLDILTEAATLERNQEPSRAESFRRVMGRLREIAAAD